MVKKIFGALTVVAVAFAMTANITAAATYNFTQDLTIGSQGAEVVMLQDFLVSKGLLVIPVGVSKGYFGALTRTALGQYQASVGISPTAGYFGPVTRAHLNNIEMGGGTTVGDDDDDSSGELSGGDGDFRQFKILGNPSNEDVEEGETVEVLGFEFEADDSDLRIERVDALFADLDSTTKPWRVFDEVLLLDSEGDEIASVDASDKGEWEEEEDDQYSLRFEDVDYVVEEGDKVQLFIAVTASDSIKAADLDEWGVQLMRDGVRALNAIGIDVYEGGSDDEIDSDSDERKFQLEVVQAGDLSINIEEEDNKDKTVAVKDDEDTDDVVLFTAVIEGDEGDNLIEEIAVRLATTTDTVGRLDEIIKTLYLFIDGDEVGSESVNGGGEATTTFEDIDFDLDEDEEVEVQVIATINEQDGNFSDGDGVVVTGIEIDFVDDNDDDQTISEFASDLGGEIEFSLGAVQVESVSSSATAPLAGDESKGRFKVRFTVTAPEDDAIYIPKGSATSTDVDSGAGAVFQVVDGQGTVFASTTATVAGSNLLTRISGGSTSGNYYKISKGNSATFEVDVVVSNTGHATEQTLGIEVIGLNYKVGGSGTADSQHTAGFDEEFRSETEYLLTANTQN